MKTQPPNRHRWALPGRCRKAGWDPSRQLSVLPGRSWGGVERQSPRRPTSRPTLPPQLPWSHLASALGPSEIFGQTATFRPGVPAAVQVGKPVRQDLLAVRHVLPRLLEFNPQGPCQHHPTSPTSKLCFRPCPTLPHQPILIGPCQPIPCYRPCVRLNCFLLSRLPASQPLR